MSEILDSEREEPRNPPVSPRKERFSLSKRDWAAYSLGAAGVLLTEPFQRTASLPPGRLLPFVFGHLAGLMIVAVLPSLLAFYLSRRSRNALSTTFAIFIALGAIGQIGEAVRNGGRALDDETVLNRVGPKLLGWLRNQVAPYRRACEEMAEKSLDEPSWLKERTDLVALRERVARARKANRELRDLFSRASPVIREELLAQGVPEGDCARLGAVISDHLAKTRVLFAGMRDQDDAIATELLKLCDLLDENWAHWHFDGNAGTIVFDDNAANREFRGTQVKLRKLAQEQERDRAEFLRATQQGRKPESNAPR